VEQIEIVEPMQNGKQKVTVEKNASVEQTITVKQGDGIVEQEGLSVEQEGVSVEQKGVSVEQEGVSVEQKGVSVEQEGVSVELLDRDLWQKFRNSNRATLRN